MSGLEIVERVMRFGSGLALVLMFWLMQGGEQFIITPTPISGFLVHLLGFFFLAGACLVGWADRANQIVPGLVVLAIILEAGQIVFPDRMFSLFDMSGNVIGVLLGWVFFKTLRQYSRTI